MSARAELYGSPDKPITVVGSLGVDAQGLGHLPHDKFPPESKTAVTYGELDAIKEEHGIKVMTEAPGQTALNVGVGIQKLSRNPGEIKFLAPFAPEDPSADIIKDAVTEAGVDFKPVAYDGRNPYSLIISNGGKVALVAKPDNIPTVTPDAIDPNTGLLLVASLGGNWDETYHTLMDGTESIPHGLIGSESQIKKLTDPKLRTAYGRVLTTSRFFEGNDDEAKKILELLFHEEPKEDPIDLAVQFHDIVGLGETSLTLGKAGAVVIDEERNAHVLKVKPVKHVVGTVGAGDGNGAAFTHGRRTDHSIETSMVNAAESSAQIIGTLDALSGQMTADQWDAGASAAKYGMTYEVITPRQRAKKVTVFTR